MKLDCAEDAHRWCGAGRRVVRVWTAAQGLDRALRRQTPCSLCSCWKLLHGTCAGLNCALAPERENASSGRRGAGTTLAECQCRKTKRARSTRLRAGLGLSAKVEQTFLRLSNCLSTLAARAGPVVLRHGDGQPSCSARELDARVSNLPRHAIRGTARRHLIVGRFAPTTTGRLAGTLDPGEPPLEKGMGLRCACLLRGPPRQ